MRSNREGGGETLLRSSRWRVPRGRAPSAARVPTGGPISERLSCLVGCVDPVRVMGHEARTAGGGEPELEGAGPVWHDRRSHGLRTGRFCLRRATALTLLLLVGAAFSASAGFGSSGRREPGNLRQLWSQFPLDQTRGARNDAHKRSHEHPARRGSTSGGGSLWIFLGAAAAVVVVILRAGDVYARRRRREGGNSSYFGGAAGPRRGRTPNSFQGGRIMTRPKKNWFRREGHAEQSPAPGTEERTDAPTQRIAAYAPAQGEYGETVDTEPALHRSAGEEVDVIVQTAQDAAAKLTAAITEEAERTRAEAIAAANHEVEETRHRVQTERERAAKERADAEAYAAWVRNEAETDAEKVRVEADIVATSLIEASHAKLAAADEEAERKVQVAEESARKRIGALRAEARRYADELQRQLAELHRMSQQVEAMLKSENGQGVEPVDQARREHAHEDFGVRADARSEPLG